MGIAWGVNSTWWAGLILGILLALAGRFGKGPRRSAGFFLKPLFLLCLICGFAAVLMGTVAFRLSAAGILPFLRGMSGAVPPGRQPGYMAALWMHATSYTVAAMGGSVLAVRVLFQRLEESKE